MKILQHVKKQMMKNLILMKHLLLLLLNMMNSRNRNNGPLSSTAKPVFDGVCEAMFIES